MSDVQVQLRFAPAEGAKDNIKDMYPPCLIVRLNGKMIQLPVSYWLFVVNQVMRYAETGMRFCIQILCTHWSVHAVHY